ncbi:MAG TPA: porin [Prolixibacteraceae bacterium]|nr:porin [Prolixibacteraceae bacterium]HPT30236.1 porin [Prolixibacteraceae bacterium]
MKRLILFLCLCFSSGLLMAQEDMKDDVRFNQYGKKVDRLPLAVEARDGILVMESKNQDYKLWFDIRVQTDGQLFFGDDLNPIGNGASIRRARFAAKANLSKHWYGEIDLDFANGVLELNDAYINYDFLNGLASRVGNFKERFSMSQTASSRYLNFMERAMVVTTFAPSRHIGWETAYSGKRFLAVGGIFFQEVEDAEMRTYVEDNNKDYGRDEGISLTGKFVLQPFGFDAKKGLHLAYAYSYRTPKTDVAPGEYGMARYSTRSLSSINRKKFLDTDLVPNLDYSTLSNIELAAYYKGLGLQSEIIGNKTYRKNNLETLSFGGFYVQGVYMLFGGNQVYNKAEGEFTQPDKGKKWGDVELALRYDYVNLNNKDVYGGSAEGWTAGLNFYTAKNVKFQLNYNLLNHDRYASGKKKLYVGYDVTGALTKDPMKVADTKGKAGNDFSSIGIRCEIDF